MNALAAHKHWIYGIVVALVGVLLARVISPTLENDAARFALLILGHLSCLLGLFIIAKGVFLRHREEDSDN